MKYINFTHVIFLFLLIACSQPAVDNAVSSNVTSNTTNATSVADGPSTTTSSDGGWTYDSSTDEMRGTMTKYARLDSDNVLSLGFPYETGPAKLTIRKRAKDGLAVVLQAEGQILCNGYTESHVTVKFDASPPTRYSCTSSADGDSKVAFILSESRFISRLKSSKKMIIEADFFQAGSQQLKFSTSGLKWP